MHCSRPEGMSETPRAALWILAIAFGSLIGLALLARVILATGLEGY